MGGLSDGAVVVSGVKPAEMELLRLARFQEGASVSWSNTAEVKTRDRRRYAVAFDSGLLTPEYLADPYPSMRTQKESACLLQRTIEWLDRHAVWRCQRGTAR